MKTKCFECSLDTFKRFNICVLSHTPPPLVCIMYIPMFIANINYLYIVERFAYILCSILSNLYYYYNLHCMLAVLWASNFYRISNSYCYKSSHPQYFAYIQGFTSKSIQYHISLPVCMCMEILYQHSDEKMK